MKTLPLVTESVEGEPWSDSPSAEERGPRSPGREPRGFNETIENFNLILPGSSKPCWVGPISGP